RFGLEQRLAGRLGEGQSLHVGLATRLEVVQPVREAALGGEAADPHAGVDAPFLELRLDRRSRLAEEAALLEPAPRRREDAQRDVRSVALDAPVARLAQVVDLDV